MGVLLQDRRRVPVSLALVPSTAMLPFLCTEDRCSSHGLHPRPLTAALSRAGCTCIPLVTGLPAYQDCGKHHSLNHTVEPKAGSFQQAEIHAGALAACYLLGAMGTEGRLHRVQPCCPGRGLE